MADLSTPKPAYRKVVAALAESEERYRILVEGAAICDFHARPSGHHPHLESGHAGTSGL